MVLLITVNLKKNLLLYYINVNVLNKNNTLTNITLLYVYIYICYLQFMIKKINCIYPRPK